MDPCINKFKRNQGRTTPYKYHKFRRSTNHRNDDIQVKQKMSQIIKNRRQDYLKDRLSEFYGKNYPINYRTGYDFQQRWQNLSTARKNQEFYRIKFQSKIQLFAYILFVIFNTITVWLSTINIFIGKEHNHQSLDNIIYGCTLVGQVCDLFIKIYKEPKKLPKFEQFKVYLKLGYSNLIQICFLISQIVDITQKTNTIFFDGLKVLFLILLYRQTAKLYQSLRITNFSQTHEYHFKVMDLVLTLIFSAHFIALILFISTKANHQQNWIKKYGLQTNDQLQLYLYSAYFASTTIFTVGYGDVSPANPFEVVIVILVQICGIIVFAFIINEIGFCLSSLRKKEEMLEKDLTVFEKMKEQYRLNNELSYRVNEYLVNSYKKTHILTPDEEQGVILKLNEELRNQITKCNLRSIVKSSIFFLCRWSKNMQQAVSSKLVHILYSPNDTIYQPFGKQRVYLVKSGRIGVYASLDDKEFKKRLLKVITNTLNTQAGDNCYGYTAVISSRRVRLQAVASDFSSVYYIQKDQFIGCASESIPDFEYLNEIKHKLQLEQAIQKFEAPLLLSSKYHFDPNKYYVIRKNNLTVSNTRSIYPRAQKKRFAKLSLINLQIKKLRNKISRQYLQSEKSIEKDPAQEPDRSLKNQTQKIRQTQLCESFLCQIFKFQQTLNFMNKFQSGKEYNNYFPKNNCNGVIEKYCQSNFATLQKRSMQKKTMKKYLK